MHTKRHRSLDGECQETARRLDSPQSESVGLPPSVQAVHSSWDVGCCLPVSATPLPFFFLIPQNHLQLVKNDPLKLVNVFHSFPLTSHSCDRRCPSGVGTAPLPRGSVAMMVLTSGLGLSFCLFSPACLPPQELHLAGTWQQKLLTKRLEKLLWLMLSI